MTETQTTPIETNSPEHDARIKREAEIAETARQKRAASAKTKREAKKEKPAPAKKAPPKQAGSMAEYVDGLLTAGIGLKDLETRAAAEAKRRGVKTLSTRGALNAHIAYRSKQATWKVTKTKERVTMVAVAKPSPKKAQAKAATTKPAPKTGKATGRKVAKKTEAGRQQVEPVSEPKPTS